MRVQSKVLFFFFLVGLRAAGQNDSTMQMHDSAFHPPAASHGTVSGNTASPVPVFNGLRLINAKTVEVLPAGVMAFIVVHNFGDIGGSNGGVHNFFGLDEATDAQIGFQVGVARHLNVVLQHTVGGGGLSHFYEGGLKYQFLAQGENGSPFSLTAYGNVVSSGQRTAGRDSLENSFVKSSDRLSELFQLMIARRFGAVSLQLSGTYLHTNLVIPGDQNGLFSVGAAVRFPITGKFFIISDYFHSFRSSESKATWEGLGLTPRDVFGVGVEIVAGGHVFHMNFTNARNILENRFLPRTTDSWGKGQFRWGFTITRNFNVFHPRKK